MRTLGYHEPGAPRAHRARNHRNLRPHCPSPRHGQIRGELEDLAFQHLEPDAYKEIVVEIESRRHSNEEFLTEIRQTVEAELRREGIPARIDGRLQATLLESSRKLRRQKITVDQVYDLMALRIITDSGSRIATPPSARDPQQVASHSRPHQGLHRDPAPQSLSIAVAPRYGADSYGQILFEVQIRTEEMHRIAEEGISRRTGNTRKGARARRPTISIVWLRHLVEWQRDVQDPGEFMSTLRWTTITPRLTPSRRAARVIVLPRDATPIDFAYAIRTWATPAWGPSERPDCAAALGAPQW